MIILVMFLPDGLLGLINSRRHFGHSSEKLYWIIRLIKAGSPPTDLTKRNKELGQINLEIEGR